MRSDREILKIANEDITRLTNDEFDRYQVLREMPVEERYSRNKMAHGGKASRGRQASESAETH
tara:strand:- start:69 stop:257 length:189 start_codon:yes stop_codon:yes gene_type:complete